MKIIVKLLLVAILLICPTKTNAQSLDYLNLKIKEYSKIEHTGKALTIAGGVMAVVGGAGLAVGLRENFRTGNSGPWAVPTYLGALIGGAGLIFIVPGANNWSLGRRKVKEYKIRLDDAKSGFYFNPNSVIGVALALKF